MQMSKEDLCSLKKLVNLKEDQKKGMKALEGALMLKREQRLDGNSNGREGRND